MEFDMELKVEKIEKSHPKLNFKRQMAKSRFRF